MLFNSNLLPSKKRQFPSQLCNQCARYTMEKGAVRAQGKMCLFGSQELNCTY